MHPIPSAAPRRRSGTAFRRAAGLLSLALLGACPKDSGTDPSNGPAGSYELRQVDDGALPFTIHKGPWLDRVHTRFYNKFVMDVVEGDIELDEGGNYTLDLFFDYVADGTPGNTGVHHKGSYEIDGADITFRWGSNPPGTYLGRIQNGVITIPFDFMGKGVSIGYAFRR
jgi:hypothetical protein